MIDSTIFKPLTFNEIEPNAGLRKALALTPSAIIQEITDSGLKGRGGAGFPTGMKWGYCARAAGTQKYAICNADEGEPGTFKDRVILTEYPDLVFEGMTIAARRLRSPGGARRTCSARTSWASKASSSTSRSGWAAGPTSAARRPRSSSRSRDIAANPATARRSRRTPDSTDSPPSSTTSRPSPGPRAS